MPTMNLGRIGYVNKGNWTAGTYKRLDVVRQCEVRFYDGFTISYIGGRSASG